MIEEFAVAEMIAKKAVAKGSFFFHYYTCNKFGLFFHEFIYKLVTKKEFDESWDMLAYFLVWLRDNF